MPQNKSKIFTKHAIDVINSFPSGSLPKDESSSDDFGDLIGQQKGKNKLAVCRATGDLQILYLGLLEPKTVLIILFFGVSVISALHFLSRLPEDIIKVFPNCQMLKLFSISVIIVGKTLWNGISSTFTIISAAQAIFVERPPKDI